MKKTQKKETSLLAEFILKLRTVKKWFAEFKPLRKINRRQRELSYYVGKESCEEAKISYVFGLAKIISASLLIILLLITVIFGSGRVSYEKIYYMFKDIGYIKTYTEGIPNVLSYSKPVQNQEFEDFKNGLLIASDSELKMFTSTGRITLSSGSDFINPRITTSSSYALIYDQGRNNFSIFNSFVKLYSERTDFPIAYADMSDNDTFLIVTRSAKYKSVVKVYDSEFDLTNEYSRNDNVISAVLSENGKYAAVISITAKNGDSVTTLSILDVSKNKILSEISINGSMPYMCEFLSDDRIAVIFDDRMCIFTRDGKIRKEQTFVSNIEKIDFFNDRFAVAFSNSDQTSLRSVEVFNEDGNRIISIPFNDSIKDMKLDDEYIFILGSKDVVRINTTVGSESRRRAVSDNANLVLFSDGRLSVCSQTTATYIKFD